MHKRLSRLFPPPRYLRMPAFGLDISDRSVKFAILSHKHGKLEVTRYGEEEIPEGVVTNGIIEKPTALLEILKKIKERARRKYAYVSLPEEKGYIVEMLLPASAGKDLRGAIELHLEEQVPLEAINTTFDFEIIHTPDELEGGGYIVVVSAVETSLANTYVDVCMAAGITPIAFELESEAIARSVVKDGEETNMIVDVGREQSNVSIVCRNVVRLSSSISLGGNTLGKAIVDDLGVDKDEALRLKEEEGLLRRGVPKSPFYSIIRVATILRDEIYQRLSYWNTGRERSNTKDAIKKIVLCGGNANIPGLTEYLTSGAGVPIAPGNPWVNILSFDDQIPAMTARESLKYCTAFGLALRATKYE